MDRFTTCHDEAIVQALGEFGFVRPVAEDCEAGAETFKPSDPASPVNRADRPVAQVLFVPGPDAHGGAGEM